MNAQEVGPEHGPFAFLPAPATRRVSDALRREGRDATGYATLADEDVFRHADPSEVLRLVGPAGRGLLVDASRCLHFGSRVAEGRERFLLAAVFLRFHRVRENVSSQLPPPPPGSDLLRRLALEPPRRRPRGTFLPDPLAPFRRTGGA